MPKIELLPLNDGTPIFRDFYINDIVCKGADKGVFIRGIPEMNISNIQLTNMVLETRKGIDCTEATNIRFNNVRLIIADSDPLIYLQNSNAIQFNNISYDNPAPVLFSVNGERTKNISVSKIDLTKTKNKAAFDFGAAPSSVVFK
jgi:DNA sulfur modification protein DndE